MKTKFPFGADRLPQWFSENHATPGDQTGGAKLPLSRAWHAVSRSRLSRGFAPPKTVVHLLLAVVIQYLATFEPLAAGPTNIQPSLSTNVTLTALIDQALQHNPGLQARFHQWQAALTKVPEAKTLPDPKFTYGYFISEVETRVGPQQHRIGIAQRFPWFGKLKLRSEAAAHATEAGYENLQAARLEVECDVRKLFHELIYLDQAIAITDENVQLLKGLESVAQAKFKAGGEYLGVIKTQVELSQLADRRSSLVESRKPWLAKLNASLGRMSDAKFGRLIPVGPTSPKSELPADRLRQDNPRLLAVDAAIKAAEADINLARKEFFPDVTLGLDYIATGAATAAVAGNGKDPVIAMFSINIPLWQKKLRAGVKGAKARQKSLASIRKHLTQTLQAELSAQLFRFSDAERKIELYKQTLIPQSEAALKLAEQSYQAGKADFLDMIDAQRALLEFRLQYQRSRANREQSLAEIDLLTGRKSTHQISAAKKDPPE